MTTTPSPTINVLVPEGTAIGPWPTGWTYADPDDVWIYIETGGEPGPDLVLDVDYTLTGSNPRENGGEVNLSPAAVPVGGWRPEGQDRTRLIVRRWTSRRQGVALPDAEGHKPRATEMALDRAMRIAEELSDQQDLAVVVPPGGVPPTAADLEAAAQAGALAAAAAAVAQQAAGQVFDKANRGLDNVATQREDASAVAVPELDWRQAQPRRPIEFGAMPVVDADDLGPCACDALQAMVDGAYNSGATLPGLPGGGVIEVDGTFYINRPLYLRSFVELRGTVRAGILSDHDGATNTNPGFSRWANGSLKGTIICGPNGKIVPKDSCKIRHMNIVSSAAATMPPNGDAAGLRAYVNGFNAHPIAVEGAYGGADIVVEDSFVVGFQLAFKMVYTERFDIRFCRIDCINGIYAQDIYDDSRYVYNHHWPFAIAHRIDASDPAAAQISREYGTAINFGKNPAADRSIDAGHVVGNMIYGYSVAIRLQDTNGLHCLDNWIDGPKGRTDINTTVGLVIEGNCRRTKILGNHFDSLGVLIDVKGSGGIFDNNTLSGWTDRAIRIWDGTANHFGFTMIQDGAASDGSIDFMNGAATVRFDSLWFSVGRGAAANVPTVPARRLGVSFGEIKNTTPVAGFTPIDLEQWRTSVEVARSGGPQSLTAGSYTKIVFDQTLSDGLSEWNGAQSTYTARKAGLYRVEVVFGLQPGTTAGGALAVEFRKNGGALDAYRWQTFEQGHTGIVQNGISRTIGLAAGDTLAFYAYTDTGGSVVSGKTGLRIRPA